VRTHAARVVHMTGGILPGPYRVPAYRATGHFRLTNKTPAATYRAPGRYETTFVRERLVDAVAAKLGMDANDVRRVNAISVGEMPYHRPLEALGEEIEHDSGDYVGLLDKTLAALDWETLKREIARRRKAGEAVGAGFAMFVEKSGLGPADGVRIEVDTSGMVELITGGASIGQGFETVMAQVCAEMLGVDYRRVRVTHGQTDRIAFGIGAHASRATSCARMRRAVHPSRWAKSPRIWPPPQKPSGSASPGSASKAGFERDTRFIRTGFISRW